MVKLPPFNVTPLQSDLAQSPPPYAPALKIVPPTMTSWGFEEGCVQMLSVTLLAAQQPVMSMYELS
jgi:hypothetical protein